MSYYDGQYNPQYPETHCHPQLGPSPVQYPYPYIYSVPHAYQYDYSGLGEYSCQWDQSQFLQARQRLPQQNVHLNPAVVHLNPKFFPTSVPNVPSNRKVIVNPKFFSVPAKQADAPADPPELKAAEPVPCKKTLIVNKMYSWKKIDPAEQVKHKISRPLARSSLEGNSNMRKLRRQASLKSGFKSRFKVDKRSPLKSSSAINHIKPLHTKYKIVRNAVRNGHPTSTRSEKHRLKRRFSGKFPASPKATPVRCKLFARNKWRPLANTSLSLLNNSPLNRERKSANKLKKKKESKGPAKRYYNTTELAEGGELQQADDFEVEATDQPVGLRRREPLGELPSFITLN